MLKFKLRKYTRKIILYILVIVVTFSMVVALLIPGLYF